MKINLKVPGKKGSYPHKKDMNLYVREKTANSPSTLILTAVVLVVFIVLFTRIGVIERLETLRNLRADVSEKQAQLEIIREKLSDFDEVQEKYRRYTDNYMAPEEAELVDRGEIIGIIEKNVMSVGKCPSITIRGNSVSLVVQVMSLEEIATIREKLETCGNVRNVSVYTADWSENSAYLTAGDEAVVTYVQASICFEACTGEEAAE